MKNRTYRIIIQIITVVTCLGALLSCAKGPGPNDMIQLSQDEIFFPAEGGTCTITSNFEVFFDHIFVVEEDGSLRNPLTNGSGFSFGTTSFEYDWIKASSSSSTSPQITFEAKANNEMRDRNLVVAICTVETGKRITIHQAKAE